MVIFGVVVFYAFYALGLGGVEEDVAGAFLLVDDE